MAGSWAEQAAYLQEVAELKKSYPDVDFDTEWILVDTQGWADYEEGATYWLLEHIPSGKLYQLDDLHSVMCTYKEPTWEDKFETTLEAWFEVINDVDEWNRSRENTFT